MDTLKFEASEEKLLEILLKDIPNFEDWVKSGLITNDQLVEFRSKIKETIKGKNE